MCNKDVVVAFFGTVLGVLTKLREVTISFVVFVCPSVRMEQLCSHWTDFHEILYLRILGKYVEEIQVSSKPDKYNFGPNLTNTSLVQI